MKLTSLEHTFLNKKAVAKFVQAEQFSEARPRGDRRRKLTPYLAYLQAHWEAGEHSAAKLYREIRAQGFRGLETTVRAYLSELRDETEPRAGPRRRFPSATPSITSVFFTQRRASQKSQPRSKQPSKCLVGVRGEAPDLPSAILAT